MKLRIWKSLIFFIGLILFVAAFGVILVAGSIFNPPPYRIVIALEDIPPYTVLTRDMLAVDEQTMHQKVASRLVHEAEIERYLGGMAIETVHAGEPLRRNAVVTADNPAAVHRLSLALTDPDLVAAVVPVNPKVIPDNVTAGDYVNVTMGIGGSVSQLTAAAWGEAAGTTWGASPASVATPTPIPFTSTLPLTPTGPLPLSEEAPEVIPPLDKIVLPQVQVIHVSRKKVPNPNYGMTFGQEGAQEPPFLEGDIESVTILVPKAAEELLYFAVDNGTLHISVVPHLAVLEGTSPSTGVLWEDFVTIADLESRVTEAVVGFEQHGFGVPVLRVKCEPAVGEPVYFSPCTADPDLALVVLPDEWLTLDALRDATRLYLHLSGELGPVQGELSVRRWVPRDGISSPEVPRPSEGVWIFLHPEGELACEVADG